MRTADKFCDLAGFDPEREEAVVYAHDGSQLTLIEIDGTRSIISSDDYLTNVIERFAGADAAGRADAADDPRSRVIEQVGNGVSVRMAALYLLLADEGNQL